MVRDRSQFLNKIIASTVQLLISHIPRVVNKCWQPELECFPWLQIGRNMREKGSHYQNALKKKLTKGKKEPGLFHS